MDVRIAKGFNKKVKFITVKFRSWFSKLKLSLTQRNGSGCEDWKKALATFDFVSFVSKQI